MLHAMNYVSGIVTYSRMSPTRSRADLHVLYLCVNMLLASTYVFTYFHVLLTAWPSCDLCETSQRKVTWFSSGYP